MTVVKAEEVDVSNAVSGRRMPPPLMAAVMQAAAAVVSSAWGSASANSRGSILWTDVPVRFHSSGPTEVRRPSARELLAEYKQLCGESQQETLERLTSAHNRRTGVKVDNESVALCSKRKRGRSRSQSRCSSRSCSRQGTPEREPPALVVDEPRQLATSPIEGGYPNSRSARVELLQRIAESARDVSRPPSAPDAHVTASGSESTLATMPRRDRRGTVTTVCVARRNVQCDKLLPGLQPAAKLKIRSTAVD